MSEHACTCSVDPGVCPVECACHVHCSVPKRAEMNFFGGEGFAGGSIYAESHRVADHLRTIIFADDERLTLTGREVRRLAKLLALVRRPCLTCGGDGIGYDMLPCADCTSGGGA